MSKLVWDQTGERFYETGIDRAVLYLKVSKIYPAGVAWNGLTAVTESPSGAEPTPIYNDSPDAFLVLDSTKFKSSGLVNVLRGIEEVLYGSSNASARLPLISEIRELFQIYAYL